MRRNQEMLAKDLYRALTEELARSFPDTSLSVSGSGVHWDCSASRRGRTCTISCFERNQGPEYLVAFKCNAQTSMWGRTTSSKDVMRAVGDWLGGSAIDHIYDRCSFVDNRKRSLTAIKEGVLKHYPELVRHATSEVRHIMCDIFELWFMGKDRSCRVSYYGNNEVPDALFSWDETGLFQLSTGDIARLAEMINRWLCDQAMPSHMAYEFSGVEIGQLARYFEQGRPVEGEFLESWDLMERFYEPEFFPWSEQAHGLIAGIRRAGYDKLLRAGSSLDVLVVSRSRRHGLLEGQPYLAFSFSESGMEVFSNVDGEERYSFPTIGFSERVDDLLKRLIGKEINGGKGDTAEKPSG